MSTSRRRHRWVLFFDNWHLHFVKARWATRLLLALVALALLTTIPALAQDDPDAGNLLPPKAPPAGPVTAAPAAPAAGTPATPGPSAPTTASAPTGIGSAESAWVVGALVVILLVGGVVLLLVEILLIPGFGLPGITGLLLIAASLLVGFWKLEPWMAVTHTIISVVVMVGLGFWTIFIFPHTRFGRAFVLETRIDGDAKPEAGEKLAMLVGREGVSLSDLRPSGIARIDQQRLDVVSEGDFIPRQHRIKVVAVRGTNDIVVVSLGPVTGDPTSQDSKA